MSNTENESAQHTAVGPNPLSIEQQSRRVEDGHGPQRRLRLSNSEMKLWRRCKRQWFLAYRARKGWPEPDFGKPTGLGTRVHNALEKFYDPAYDGDVMADLLEGIERDVQEYPGLETEIRKEGDLAERMLEGYFQWLEETGKDQFLKIIAPESKMSVKPHPTELPNLELISKIDVRVQDERDGSRWALEHKTVQSLTQAEGILEIDTQLLTEHLVEFLSILEEAGDEEKADALRADGVLYNMLRKVKRTATAKPPFYDRKDVRHNVIELRNHWRHVIAQAREIMHAHDRLDSGESHHVVAYPNPTRDCTWDCPFYRVCKLMDDGSDWEGLLADQYVDIDPLQRYSPQDVPVDG